MQVSPEQTSTLDAPYPHFAMMFLDHDGKLQVQASPSIAGCGGAIFTPDVTDRFMELTTLSQFGADPISQASYSSWAAQSGPDWWHAGQRRPTELIPCEWQSHRHRRKRRDVKRPKPLPQSHSPPPTPPPGRTILRVGNRKLLRRYYEKAFEDFQQLNCRAIAKSYIKLVEPRKQVQYPYNGKKVISGVSQQVDPEQTKPGWWPSDVPHREPDHLLKRDRLQLLVHILCDLKDSHGVTAEKLCEADQDVRRQITPAHRLQVLDEIYFVRQMEECFLNGEIDANTLVQVTQTHLPEAIYEVDASSHPALASAVTNADDNAHGTKGFPMSPPTSVPSNPCSPSSGGFHISPLGMDLCMGHPHTPAARCMQHPGPSYYNNLSGYFAPPFVPATTGKPSEVWAHGHAPVNPVTQY